MDTQKICPDHCLKSFIASTQNYGEGPTRAAAGAFKEDTTYTAQDVRFTTKGDTLFAITLGIPHRQLKIKSLGNNAHIIDKQVRSIQLLGSKEHLRWVQRADALVIDLPATMPTAHSSVFAIRF